MYSLVQKSYGSLDDDRHSVSTTPSIFGLDPLLLRSLNPVSTEVDGLRGRTLGSMRTEDKGVDVLLLHLLSEVPKKSKKVTIKFLEIAC